MSNIYDVSTSAVLTSIKDVLNDTDGLDSTLGDAIILDSMEIRSGFNATVLTVLAYATDPMHYGFDSRITSWAESFNPADDSEDLPVYEVEFEVLNGHDLFIAVREAVVTQFGAVIPSSHPLEAFTLARVDLSLFVDSEGVDLSKLEAALTSIFNGSVVYDDAE